mmetsp:Transcript_20577/g.66264  ORF Transcript_20577/g.66264 Transcript_20577/m.66264 type:complete len:314 (-) Transcript_20577:1129-2070(-)
MAAGIELNPLGAAAPLAMAEGARQTLRVMQPLHHALRHELTHGPDQRVTRRAWQAKATRIIASNVLIGRKPALVHDKLAQRRKAVLPLLGPEQPAQPRDRNLPTARRPRVVQLHKPALPRRRVLLLHLGVRDLGEKVEQRRLGVAQGRVEGGMIAVLPHVHQRVLARRGLVLVQARRSQQLVPLVDRRDARARLREEEAEPRRALASGESLPSVGYQTAAAGVNHVPRLPVRPAHSVGEAPRRHRLLVSHDAVDGHDEVEQPPKRPGRVAARVRVDVADERGRVERLVGADRHRRPPPNHEVAEHVVRLDGLR